MSDDLLPPPQPPDCTCMARDGEPEDNERWPDWLTLGCPVHGDKLAPVADGEPPPHG